jgi:hypothetical protein
VATAAVALAPAISSSRGKWDAIAPVTNQVAANTKERSSIAPRGADPAVPCTSVGLMGGGARGINSRFNGSPIKRFSAAQTRPAHCAGEPGDQGDPGDRTARRPAIETSKRSEGRIVETHRHPDAEDRPRGHKADNALRQRQEDQPGREDKIRQREHAAAAMSVYHPADRRTENGGDQQRAREDAEHDGA